MVCVSAVGNPDMASAAVSVKSTDSMGVFCESGFAGGRRGKSAKSGICSGQTEVPVVR